MNQIFELILACVANYYEDNQIFELILEQCVAIYYEDNMITK